ncbi:MAG TPA: hypothetical protein VIN40_03475 [Candidatus Tyrphobacter sp.]
MATLRLNPRARLLTHRPWTPRERRVVRRGLEGRMAIAIEPLLGLVFFGFFAWGIIWRAQHVHAEATLIVIAPIFALGALAFLGYFIAVLVAPIVAYVKTFQPIYIVDGYVRYRPPDEDCAPGECGYVAALFEDESIACEWKCTGMKPYSAHRIPAMVEFSAFAGIHKIDGRSTGLLPDGDLPPLAIGIAPRR